MLMAQYEHYRYLCARLDELDRQIQDRLKEDELAVLLEIHRQESVRQQQQEARARLGTSDPTEG